MRLFYLCELICSWPEAHTKLTRMKVGESQSDKSKGTRWDKAGREQDENVLREDMVGFVF